MTSENVPLQHAGLLYSVFSKNSGNICGEGESGEEELE